MAEVFFTEEQKKLRDHYRELVREYVLPRVKEIDEKNAIPQDLLPRLTTEPFHLNALSVPKKYGGLELGKLDVCIIAEEIGYGCPALIPLLEIAQLFVHVLRYSGSEEQQRRYLTRLVEGQIGCYALTDEGPGSDPVNMKTTARRDGEEYIINGKKRLITFADMADFCAVFAKTNPQAGSRGISAFILEKGQFKLAEFTNIFGLRGHRAWTISLKDVRVPASARVGEEGEGLRLALKVLNTTRISLAWGYIGLARAAYDAARAFAAEREIAGQKLKQHQSISFALAELATQIDAARLLAYRAAVMSEKGLNHRKETSMAKMFAGETLVKAVTLANRILGGYGCDAAYPVERYVRDAFSWIAAQGTMEVQKLIIAREIFRD